MAPREQCSGCPPAAPFVHYACHPFTPRAPRILFQHRIFGHSRLLLQFTVGSLPHKEVLRSIELYGTKVAPVVRRELGAPDVPSGAGSTDTGGEPSQAPTPGSGSPSGDQK